MLAGIVVFALVTFAWIFFRAPSLAAAGRFLSQLILHPAGANELQRFVPVLLLSAGLLLYEWLTRRWEHGLAIAAVPMAARWLAYVGICMAIIIFGYLGATRAIYVQF